MLKILKKIHFLACNFWNTDFFKIIQKTIKSTHPWLQNDIKKVGVVALNFTQKKFKKGHDTVSANFEIMQIMMAFLRKIESNDPNFFLYRSVAKDV